METCSMGGALLDKFKDLGTKKNTNKRHKSTTNTSTNNSKRHSHLRSGWRRLSDTGIRATNSPSRSLGIRPDPIQLGHATEPTSSPLLGAFYI